MAQSYWTFCSKPKPNNVENVNIVFNVNIGSFGNMDNIVTIVIIGKVVNIVILLNIVSIVNTIWTALGKFENFGFWDPGAFSILQELIKMSTFSKMKLFQDRQNWQQCVSV